MVGKIQATASNKLVIEKLQDIFTLMSNGTIVTAYQGGAWSVGRTWALNSATDSVTIVATDLDIRNLTFAADKVDASGSSITISNFPSDFPSTAENTKLDEIKTKLDSLIAKDFATQTTLALIKAKTDNLDVAASTLATVAKQYEMRPSEKSGRTYKTATLSNQTADATLYTVTGGKTLYLTSIQVSAFNTSTSASGILLITDGNGGTTRIPYLMTAAGIAAQLAASAAVAITITFTEPLQFTSAVYMDITSGTVTFSGMMVGYEE